MQVNLRGGEKIERQVSLSSIATSQNPRVSHRGLLEMFHEKRGTPEGRREFVAHIDANFPRIAERAASLPFFGAESPYIVDATPTSERPKGARRGGSPLG